MRHNLDGGMLTRVNKGDSDQLHEPCLVIQDRILQGTAHDLGVGVDELRSSVAFMDVLPHFAPSDSKGEIDYPKGFDHSEYKRLIQDVVRMVLRPPSHPPPHPN